MMTVRLMRVEIRGSREDKEVAEDWSDVLRWPVSGGRAAGKGEANVTSREAICEPSDL